MLGIVQTAGFCWSYMTSSQTLIPYLADTVADSLSSQEGYRPEMNDHSQASLTYSKVTLASRWNLKSLAVKNNF